MQVFLDTENGGERGFRFRPGGPNPAHRSRRGLSAVASGKCQVASRPASKTIARICDPSTTFPAGFAGSTMRLTARARMLCSSIPTWPKRLATPRR